MASFPHPDDREDIPLCPVRALRLYLQASLTPLEKPESDCLKHLTGGYFRGFLHSGLLLVVQSTVLRAYNFVGLPPPQTSNPHETTVVAYTVELHSYCSLNAIMEVCLWKSDTALTSHYLRDISETDVQGLHHFNYLWLNN